MCIHNMDIDSQMTRYHIWSENTGITHYYTCTLHDLSSSLILWEYVKCNIYFLQGIAPYVGLNFAVYETLKGTYIHVHVYHVHTYLHVYLYLKMYLYMKQTYRIYIHTCMHTYIHTCTQLTHIYTYIHQHTMHNYTHTYIHTYIQVMWCLLS